MDHSQQIYDLYDNLRIVIEEIETDTNFDLNIILKKIIFLVSCDLSSLFLDDIFLISKLKFQAFTDSKKFNKVMLDILYQILKQFNMFQYKCIINLFETLSIGNYENESMIFFLKVLLTFYYMHQIVMRKIKYEEFSIEIYNKYFKEYFMDGMVQMKTLLSVIPIIEINQDKDDLLIFKVFRIDNEDTLEAKTSSRIQTPTTLGPVKVKSYSQSKLSESMQFSKEQDNFFMTDMK